KEVTTKAEQAVAAEQQKAETLVASAHSEARSLVETAERRLADAETEAKNLREQNRQLTVDEAKRQIEKEQYDQAQQRIAQLQTELAEQKTHVVRLTTENTGYDKDIQRVSGELKEAKAQLVKSADAQVLLIEAQKQVSVLQHDLSQAQREKDSLAQALAVATSANTKTNEDGDGKSTSS
ncbi:hypothetical protein BFV93_4326, partial [Alteromonas macleodii]